MPTETQKIGLFSNSAEKLKNWDRFPKNPILMKLPAPGSKPF